jgi:heme/copper-type cytochrome/quinol oxidase subunit 1
MTTIDTHVSSAPATSGSGLACVAEWLTTTDLKRIGRLYIGAGALTFVGAGVVALLLAIERISPTREMLDVGSLTQLFSLQRFGLTYLALVPLLLGVALAIVPLQVGSRSLAFPRLAAAGFWAWLIGAVLAVVALVNNGGPNGGNARFVDLFTLAAALVAAGLLAGVVSVTTTVLTTRAPGMNMRRVPFYTWSVLVGSLGLLVALPMLIGNLIYIYIAHRYASVSDLSGNRAFGQWAGFAFTQPTTIVFAIPVFGFLAETVATATRQRLRPRGFIYAGIALVGVAVFGTALQWPATLRVNFMDASFGNKLNDLLPFALVHLLPLLGAFIAVSLSLKGLATKPKVSTPLVFALFAGLLAFGGVAASALNHIGDAGLVGTTFEEGTWTALVFAGVLAAMGAVAYWGPKWWGRSLPMKASLPLGLLAFAGAGVSALSLMIAGFADQPGGVFPAVETGNDAVVNFDYSGPMGLWNALNAVGIGLVLVSVLAFAALALRSFRTGDAVGDDPWDGLTLEWATTSPAPTDNFAEVHIVHSGEPLLDLKPANPGDA